MVFLFQLFRDQIAAGVGSVKEQVPALTLPSVQNNPGFYRIAQIALLIVVIGFAFMASRNLLDLATLVMIYVMLGLGLNIQVGLAGLLDLGYVGFYAIGAYTYALLNQASGIS